MADAAVAAGDASPAAVTETDAPRAADPVDYRELPAPRCPGPVNNACRAAGCYDDPGEADPDEPDADAGSLSELLAEPECRVNSWNVEDHESRRLADGAVFREIYAGLSLDILELMDRWEQEARRRYPDRAVFVRSTPRGAPWVYVCRTGGEDDDYAGDAGARRD